MTRPQPPVYRFSPARTPGPQLESSSSYKPIELFKLFFPYETVKTLCDNTHKQAAKNIAQGKKYKWTKLTVDAFYK